MCEVLFSIQLLISLIFVLILIVELLLLALLSINLALLLFIGSRMQLHYTRSFYSRNLQRYGELLERVDTTEALALTRAFHSDPMHPIPNESPTQPQ